MTVFMVTHKMRYHGQECRNVYYYETTVGDPSTSEWGDIVDEIRADYVAQHVSQCNIEFSFYAIDYRVVDTLGLPTLTVVPTSGDVDGSDAQDSLPSQVAMLVIVKGDTSKPRQGRTFLCGYHQGVVVDSLFLGSTRGIAETFIDLQSGLNAGGTNPLQRVAAQWNTSHTLVTAYNNIAGFAAVASIVPAT